jgi:hypothetical protein
MTEEDKYALREFLQGAGVVFGIVGILITILMVLAYSTAGGEPLSSSFEVVDKYKECDIVRYAPHQGAEYKYFLYCGKNNVINGDWVDT